MNPLRAEASWPFLDVAVWVQSFHHATQLLCYVALLRLLVADLGELLSFAACIVAAPLAEDDGSDLHFVV